MKQNTFLYFISLIIFFSCSKSQEDIIKEYEKNKSELISFKFEKTYNPELEEDIEMEILSNNIISGYLKQNLDSYMLKPTFTLKNGTIYYNGIKQQSKVDAQNYNSIVSLNFTTSYGVVEHFEVNLVKYTDLPVVVINTADGKGIDNKSVWKKAYLKVDGMSTSGNYEDSVLLKGIDNNAWVYNKKTFEVKLPAESEMLGMSPGNSWNFLANYHDRTLLRNDAAFHISEITDYLPWTPKSEFVNVILNGYNIGNYQLSQQIKIGKNNVDIVKMNESDINETTITGGYLLEIEKKYNTPLKFISAYYKLPFLIKSAETDNFDIKQKTYIENYINLAEDALKNRVFDVAYEYIDKNSFVDYWIVNALMGNIALSTPSNIYCYKDRNGKLMAGPIFDFEHSTLSTGSKTSSNMNIESWWYKDLFASKEFINTLKIRFAGLKPQLANVPEYIETKAKKLERSETINWEIWKIDPNDIINGDENIDVYYEAIDRMCLIYRERLNLLEKTINEL